MFKKLLDQPPSVLLPKLKQMGASALIQRSPPPTSVEATVTSAHAKTTTAKEASASKIKYSSHFPLLCVFCHWKLIDLSFYGLL